MKITYKDEEIELKQTLRTLMIYENISDKSFVADNTITNMVLYFYCNVLACSKDMDIDFNEFVEFLDENPNLMNEYYEWVNAQNKVNNMMHPVKETKEKKRVAKQR